MNIIHWTDVHCLDSNSNGNVYTNPCWPGDQYQQWYRWGNDYQGTYQNVATKWCLDTAGSSIFTWPCVGGPPNGYNTWRHGY